MGSNAICDLLDFRRYVLFLGEIDEVLSTHLHAKVALGIASINGNCSHAHGPEKTSQLHVFKETQLNTTYLAS